MIAWLRRRLGGRPAVAALAGDGPREAFRRAAAATGRPRGLRWVAVEPNGGPVVVWDRVASRWTGLVPVVVRWEPEPGSEMEHVEAARTPRPAVAVFGWARGGWVPDPKAVFNLSVDELIERSGGRYERA